MSVPFSAQRGNAPSPTPKQNEGTKFSEENINGHAVIQEYHAESLWSEKKKKLVEFIQIIKLNYTDREFKNIFIILLKKYLAAAKCQAS